MARSTVAEAEGRLVLSSLSEEERARYGGCFACGTRNPIGLRLEFHVADEDNNDAVTAIFQPEEAHQGWPNVLHGGLVATLLDEAAAYVAYARGEHAATARLNLRFSMPAPLDEPLRVDARLVRATRRLLEVGGEVTTLSGKPIAAARATLMLLTDHQKQGYGLTTGPTDAQEE